MPFASYLAVRKMIAKRWRHADLLWDLVEVSVVVSLAALSVGLCIHFWH